MAGMTRTAHLVRSGRTLRPFGDPVGEIRILDRPLRVWQEETLAARGFRVAPLDPADAARLDAAPGDLVLDDDLFFTPELLDDFLARAAGRPAARCALRKGLFTRQLAILQDLPENESLVAYPLALLSRGGRVPADLPLVALEPDEFAERGAFPPHMIGREEYRFGLTARPLLALRHPIHIGLANTAANLARLARYRRLGAGEKLRVLARALSLDRHRLLAAVSTIERGADVHPTAVVEGSVVRRGARIGAYAVVRHSFVGEGAFIDDHAGVKFSVVGAGAYIANDCVLFFTTVYPRAFLISGPYQFCVFGADSAIMNSIPCDYRLDGRTIRVRAEGGTRDTGLRFAGSIIGHRTRIAAGLIIAPGREIPNDLELYPDPARVLAAVPDLPAAGGRFRLVDGKLEAIG